MDHSYAQHMPKRVESTYSESSEFSYPDGLGGGGLNEVTWFPQNEGQKVESGALHYPQTQYRSPKGGQGEE